MYAGSSGAVGGRQGAVGAIGAIAGPTAPDEVFTCRYCISWKIYLMVIPTESYLQLIFLFSPVTVTVPSPLPNIGLSKFLTLVVLYSPFF